MGAIASVGPNLRDRITSTEAAAPRLQIAAWTLAGVSLLRVGTFAVLGAQAGSLRGIEIGGETYLRRLSGLETMETISAALGYLQWAAIIAVFALFLTFVHRAYVTLGARGHDAVLANSPLGAVAAFLVPLVNVVKPRMVLEELESVAKATDDRPAIERYPTPDRVTPMQFQVVFALALFVMLIGPGMPAFASNPLALDIVKASATAAFAATAFSVAAFLLTDVTATVEQAMSRSTDRDA